MVIQFKLCIPHYTLKQISFNLNLKYNNNTDNNLKKL